MNGHVTTLSRRFGRSAIAHLGAGCTLLAVAGLATIIGTGQQSIAQSRGIGDVKPPDDLRDLIEISSEVRRPTLFDAVLLPLGQGTSLPATHSRGICPPVTTTHSSVDFGGTNQELGIQAGFVAGEACGASYTIDPAEFPIVVRTTEWLIAREFIGGTVTTEYTLQVYQGTPSTGTLIAQFSSDDVILPHATMQPNVQALNVQITVDPSDPEQIVVENDGSNTFTVVYGIDVMNSPPQSSCNLGFTPAPCCPHNTQSNAFPTTDSINPNQADVRTGNWLFCRSNCGLGSCPGGWHRFDQLGAFEPGGDWNIQVTYEPFDCPSETFGACCFSNGTCSNEFNSICTQLGGSFQGDGTDCNVEGCPDPVGACCFFPQDPPGPAGSTCSLETQSECASRHDPENGMYAVWSGPGVQCTGTACPDTIGACCFSDGSCVTLSFSNCGQAGGEFQGLDTDCNTLVCNPFGACCMPDGSCNDEFETDCIVNGGVFQGHDNLCASVSCPQPLGACCLANGNCINEVQASCIAIPGATWQGMGTDCGDADMNGTADDCEEDPAVGACCLDSGSCIIESQSNCEGVPNTTYLGDGTVCDDCTACKADIATSAGPGQDGVVDVFDLLELLANWNTNGNGANIALPDNIVDVFDLLDLLSFWSPNPCP